MNGNTQLIVAATLSFIASLLHVAIVFGGPDWYRFFGAGESMAKLAEAGSHYPTFVTLIIALILAIWGLYALSGAGIIPPLPWPRVALVGITTIYLLRGIAGLFLPFFTTHPAITQNSVTFWLVSSSICCAIGIFYLFGTLNNWAEMGK